MTIVQAEPVTLRRLSAADLPEITAIHSAAFRNSVITALGTGAIRRYYAWQMSGPHDSVTLGVEVDGALAGFCVGGVFRGALSGYLRANRLYLGWCLATRPWVLRNAVAWNRLATGLRVTRKRPQPAPPTARAAETPKSFGILSIAVHPRYQGRGAGMALMRESERVARERGFTRMHLTVEPANEQAIRVYERSGWRRKETPSQPWNGSMFKEIA